MSDFEYEISKVVRVLDGDTLDLELRKETEVGFGHKIVWQGVIRARLVLIDTPEKGTVEYDKATQFTRLWVNFPGARQLRARTFRPRNVTADGGFGRWLTDIYDTVSGDTLSGELLKQGFVEYRRGR